MLELLRRGRCTVTTGARIPPLLRKSLCSAQQRSYSDLKCPDAFDYTSTRWLYNESLRLKERYLKFNISELVQAAAAASGRDKTDVRSIVKLAEGCFHRMFEITMHDGLQVIARLPYPSTEPKQLTLASEVATMDLVRAHGVPVPRVYGYSCDADNSVGAEYMLMAKARGKPLSDAWSTLSDAQWVDVLSQIAKVEAKVFTIDFPASGSLFYERDLLPSMDRIPFRVEGLPRMCVGPDIHHRLWSRERSTLDIPRKPYLNSTEVLTGGASKEMAWLRQYGRPRFPLDRIYREITDYQKSESQELYRNLERYLQVASYLVPKEPWLQKPVLKHSHLATDNIFISDDCKITDIISWRYSQILPLFLQAHHPESLRNTGDEDSHHMLEPQLPPNLEDRPQEEQDEQLALYRKHHVHYHYIMSTAAHNPLHLRALEADPFSLHLMMYQRVRREWDGNPVPLAVQLMYIEQNWKEMTSPDVEDSDDDDGRNDKNRTKDIPPCPISFTVEENNACAEAVRAQNQVDDSVAAVREYLGIGPDDQVYHRYYQDIVRELAELKESALSEAKDDVERRNILRHWPWDDFDEDE